MLTVNQEDKPEIIEKILKYYRKGWSDYDRGTLVEQVKDVQHKPENPDSLTKEQLINVLIDDDRIIKNDTSYFELNEELKELETVTF